MFYKFSEKASKLNPEEVWQFVENGLSNNVTIKSIGQGKVYTINYINNQEISLSASTRNAGNPEIITKADFLLAMGKLKNFTEFNTSIAKDAFKGGKIYRKRSPIFALLQSSGFIVKCI